MEVKDILKQITDICIANNAEKVILFGSFAKGTFHKTSDIDIAIIVPNEADFDKIDMSIKTEILTLRKIDLINLNQIGLNKNLKEDIYRYGKILYEKI